MYGRYGKVPASVIAKALIAGANPPEFKQKRLHMVDITRDWRSDVGVVFHVLRRALDEWHTVEVADKTHANLKE